MRVKHGRKPPAGSGTLALQNALEIQQLRLQVRDQEAYLWPLSPVTKRKWAKGIKQESMVDRMCWFPSRCLSSVPLICSKESLRARTPPCWPMRAELSSAAPSPPAMFPHRPCLLLPLWVPSQFWCLTPRTQDSYIPHPDQDTVAQPLTRNKSDRGKKSTPSKCFLLSFSFRASTLR